MRSRIGPSSSSMARAARRHPVDKSSFPHPLALVAPPILFQQRVAVPAQCAFSYSDRWIRQQHRASVAAQCSGLHVCDADHEVPPHPAHVVTPRALPPGRSADAGGTRRVAQASPSRFFECSGGELMRDGKYYGLQVTTFQQQPGFADALSSYTRRSFLTRGGDAMATAAFLDRRTQVREIPCWFYCRFAIASLCLTSPLWYAGGAGSLRILFALARHHLRHAGGCGHLGPARGNEGAAGPLRDHRRQSHCRLPGGAVRQHRGGATAAAGRDVWVVAHVVRSLFRDSRWACSL
jgi:hypothetical protein